MLPTGRAGGDEDRKEVNLLAMELRKKFVTNCTRCAGHCCKVGCKMGRLVAGALAVGA